MDEYLLLLKMIGVLLLVLALAYLALRYGLRALCPGAGRSCLRVLEKIPLEAKSGSALVLVQAGEELLLLGMARGGVTLIKELDPAGETAAQYRQPSAEPLTARPAFAGILKQAGDTLFARAKRKDA